VRLRKLRHRIQAIARGFALCGCTLLCAMAILVVASILGRVIVGRPIAGDFEIVAMCTAICAFLCLPYCHLQRGNIVVTVFVPHAGSRLANWLDAVASVVYGLIALVFAWRMSAGLVDAVRYRDMSVIIGLPLWWAYPPAVLSFLLLAASCATTAISDLREESE